MFHFFKQLLRTKVRGHDEEGIFAIDDPSLTVCDSTIIKDLQKVFRRWHKLGMNKYEGADVSEVSLKPQEQAVLNDMDTVCGKLVPLLRRSWPPR